MSVDRRLREELHASADPLSVDMERAFDAVITGARRRRYRTRIVNTVVVAAAAASLFVAVDLARNGNGPTPSPAQTAPSSAPSIAGRYVIDVPPEATGNQHGLTGRWTVVLGTDGSMSLEAPPGFSATTDGASFSISGQQMRTDLFVGGLCQGAQATQPLGVYQWSWSGPDLVFTAITEECAPRGVLFAGRPWQAIR